MQQQADEEEQDDDDDDDDAGGHTAPHVRSSIGGGAMHMARTMGKKASSKVK